MVSVFFFLLCGRILLSVVESVQIEETLLYFSFSIDQLDKADPPQIPETYIYYLALVCLNSIADGLAGFVLPVFSAFTKQTPTTSAPSTDTASTSISPSSSTNTTNPALDSHPLHKDIVLVTDMANTAWPGLLAALSFFLSANLDEELFHGVMRAYQNFTNVCGVLTLTIPRDAFLTSLCKISIPASPGMLASIAEKASSSSVSLSTASSATVVDTSVGVLLSDKNLYCLRVLLNVTMFLGGVLGDSWYLVLETLQQADHILFGRPVPRGGSVGVSSVAAAGGLRRQVSTSSVASITGVGGQGVGGTPGMLDMDGVEAMMKGGEQESGAQNVLRYLTILKKLNFYRCYPGNPSTTTMMDSDHLAIIQTSFKRLFENSKFLDDTAFMSFTRALCRLSAEASGAPFGEPGEPWNVKSVPPRSVSIRCFVLKSSLIVANIFIIRPRRHGLRILFYRNCRTPNPSRSRNSALSRP